MFVRERPGFRRGRSRSAGRGTVCPMVEALEDRTLPSATPSVESLGVRPILEAVEGRTLQRDAWFSAATDDPVWRWP